MKVNEEKEKENLLPCLLPGFLKLCSQNSKSFLSPLAMDLRSSLLSWKNILSLKLKTLWKLASYLSLCQSRLLFKQCPQKYPSLSSPKTHLSAPKKVSLSKAPPQKYLPEILSTLTSKTKESPLQLPERSFSSSMQLPPPLKISAHFPLTAEPLSPLLCTTLLLITEDAPQYNGLQILMPPVNLPLALQKQHMILHCPLKRRHVIEQGSSTWPKQAAAWKAPNGGLQSILSFNIRLA